MGQRKFRFGIVAGSLALLILGASPARAQLWLDPAYPGRSKLGPAKAAGAVIWSHGRSIDSEDSQAPIPPYMGTLRDGGWDTFRFHRMRASDTLAASPPALPPPLRRLHAALPRCRADRRGGALRWRCLLGRTAAILADPAGGRRRRFGPRHGRATAGPTLNLNQAARRKGTLVIRLVVDGVAALGHQDLPLEGHEHRAVRLLADGAHGDDALGRPRA